MSILKGKSFSVGGDRRYALTVWQFVAVAAVCIAIFIAYRDGQVMKELATQQYVVYEVDKRGNISVHPAEDYQVGPLPVEIEGRAIDVVRWIVKADSNDVDTAREEARRTMSDDMARDFDSRFDEAWAEKIKKLNIYRIIDQINARPLKPEDLPAESRGKVRITKYDIVVYGKVQTYRRGTSDWIDESNFAIHVTLQPQEARTKENMSALKVDLMSDIDPKLVEANNQPATTTSASPSPKPANTTPIEEKKAQTSQNSNAGTQKNEESSGNTANK